MMTLSQLQTAEARRRLKLLGVTIEEAKGTLLQARSRQVGVSVMVLRQWHSRYLRGGLDALVPTEWIELPDSMWSLIDQRYSALGDLAEAETITTEDIHQLAGRQGWTVRQAGRWLRRYRVGGMFGLAPNTSHLKPKGGKTRQESSKSGILPESKKQGAFNVQITRDGRR